MTLQDYEFMEKLTKMFRLDDNAVIKKTSEDKDKQRTASVIANNIQSSTTEQDKDQLCANMISEVVKVAAERVIGESKQSRTGSVSSTKIDEVGLLKKYMGTYP